MASNSGINQAMPSDFDFLNDIPIDPALLSDRETMNQGLPTSGLEQRAFTQSVGPSVPSDGRSYFSAQANTNSAANTAITDGVPSVPRSIVPLNYSDALQMSDCGRFSQYSTGTAPSAASHKRSDSGYARGGYPFPQDLDTMYYGGQMRQVAPNQPASYQSGLYGALSASRSMSTENMATGANDAHTRASSYPLYSAAPDDNGPLKGTYSHYSRGQSRETTNAAESYHPHSVADLPSDSQTTSSTGSKSASRGTQAGQKAKASRKSRKKSATESNSDHAEQQDTLLDDLKSKDPFEAAEKWIKEVETAIVPLPIKNDDLNETMKSENVIAMAMRMREALLEKPEEPTTAYARKQLNNSVKKLQDKVSGDFGQNKALTHCISVLRQIRDIHTIGIPRKHLPEFKRASSKYGSEILKCSERCETVIEAIRSNKQVALDIMDLNSDNMRDFARAPTRFQSRKLVNSRVNEQKAGDVKTGREARKGGITSGQAVSEQEQQDGADDAQAQDELDVPEADSTATTTATMAVAPQIDGKKPTEKRGAKSSQKTVTSAAQGSDHSGEPEVHSREPEVRTSKKRALIEISEGEEDDDGREDGPSKTSKRIKTAQEVAPRVAPQVAPEDVPEDAPHTRTDYGVRRTATGRLRKRAEGSNFAEVQEQDPLEFLLHGSTDGTRARNSYPTPVYPQRMTEAQAQETRTIQAEGVNIPAPIGGSFSGINNNIDNQYTQTQHEQRARSPANARPPASWGDMPLPNSPENKADDDIFSYINYDGPNAF